MFSKENEPRQLKKLDGTAISLEEVAKLYGKEDGMKIMVDGEDVVNKYNLRPKGMDLSAGWPDVQVPNGVLSIDPNSGKFILKIFSSVKKIELKASHPVPSKSTSIQVVDNYAYVTDSDNGLRIVELSNPKEPIKVVSINGITYAVKIADNFAYVSASSGVYIFDVSNPKELAPVGFIKPPGYALYSEIVGDYLYVASYTGGLQVFKIKKEKDPADPSKEKVILSGAGFYKTPGEANHVKIVGEYAYVADGDKGLQIIKIDPDPHNPDKLILKKVGFYSDDKIYTSTVEIVGKYAYINGVNVPGTDAKGVIILDISDSKNPHKVSPVLGLAPQDIKILGNFMFIADPPAGSVSIYDITNPAQPKKKRSFNTDGNAFRMCIVDDYIYVANYDQSGLQIFKLVFDFQAVDRVQVDYNY